MRWHNVKMPRNATARECQNIVRCYLLTPSTIPELATFAGRSVTSTEVRSVHLALTQMFLAIFTVELSGEEAMHRAKAYVMIFLSKYNRLHLCVHPKREKPVWVTKYNLVSLLCMPQHFTLFRHVRTLYEGHNNGEGIVRVLRPLCPLGVKPGWAMHLIKNFYRRQTIKTFVC